MVATKTTDQYGNVVTQVSSYTYVGEQTMTISEQPSGFVQTNIHRNIGGIESSAQLGSYPTVTNPEGVPEWDYRFDLPEGVERGTMVIDGDDEGPGSPYGPGGPHGPDDPEDPHELSDTGGGAGHGNDDDDDDGGR